MNLRTLGGTTLMMLTAGLMACSDSAPMVTVDYLLKHPDELKRLQRDCHEHRAEVGESTCVIVNEARNQRFWGDGKTRYTPGGPVSHE